MTMTAPRIMISRRGFIKAVATAAAIVAAPSTIIAAISTEPTYEFDDGELGFGMSAHAKDYSETEITRIINHLLIPSARSKLGHGTIEFRAKAPTNFGREFGIAWYTNKEIINLPPDPISEPTFNPIEGYYYIGRCQL